jgi:NitT/TauT family transport system substrate-binding protein
MRTRRVIARLMSGAALALGVLAAPGASAADTVRVGKAVGIAWTFIGVDVGVHEGIFARYGLDVEITAFGGDAKLQQALAANSVDFGLGSGPAMAFAVKGAPIVAIAAFANEPRDISVVLPAESAIKTVADLKGKLLAISTGGSLTEWLVKRVSTTEGWGTDGIRTAAIGDAAAQNAALRSRQVDGTMGSTENGFQLEERGEGRVLVGMERYAPHFVTHVIFANKQLVADQPELVNRFLKGFFASLAFVKANKAKTTQIAMSLQGESAAVLDKAYDVEEPMMVLDGQFDPQGLELIKESFVAMKVLDRRPADDEILTQRFLPVQP